MLPDGQKDVYQADIVYYEPMIVFTYWYNKFRQTYPGERPALKWLSAHSHLPLTTCQYYRHRMEMAFPDAYAVAHAAKNLRLAKGLCNQMRFKPPIAP